jgi:hypothetical protein
MGVDPMTFSIGIDGMADLWIISALAVIAVATSAVFMVALAHLFTRGDEAATPPTGWLAPLHRPRRIERWIYRHHRATGALITIGAGYALFALVASGDGAGPLPTGAWSVPIVGVELLAMLFGMLVFFRPSLLKSLEGAANRWIDVESGRPGLLLIAASSAYCLVGLALLFLKALE